jgi:hypothetical protein
MSTLPLILKETLTVGWQLSIARQLPFAPMRVSAIGMTLSAPHDADPRKHRRSTELDDRGFHRSLPFRDLYT